MLLFRQNFIVKCWKQLRFYSSTTEVLVRGCLPAAAYSPSAVERNKYRNWEREGRFKADVSCGKPSFSMVLPPPNVTGSLHLGHALACTIQDVIVRRQKSLGNNVLWLPGTDHAGIATQTVVEKYLKNNSDMSRHNLGRDKFIKEVWKWKELHGNKICEQLRVLGCSLDWSRQTFTMDPKHTHSVNTAFIDLFDKGLVYRKTALVNWCKSLKSTVSDIEIDHLEIKGPTNVRVPDFRPVKFGQLYEFAYKVCDSGEEVVVSTTMPETVLGDTAVAVHPQDERYKHLQGKRVIHPFLRKTIPIIYDDFVDMQFGTGAVKITPAHSKIDYIIAKDHQLPMIQVISEDGLMQNSGTFDGMNKYECREQVIKQLTEMALLKNVQPHNMYLPICNRTGDIIDYLPKEQWFLSCSTMNEKAAQMVENGSLKIVPEKFVRYWLDWADEDRDWCISRQLWWGHQIPAYKCSVGKDHVWIAAQDANKAKIKAAEHLRTLPEIVQTERDPDVLDTWFSSGIYPFAVLGWPNEHYNQDYSEFYPLSLMATGHDILGLWVHRMVMLGLELTGKLPFEKILLHGVICDSTGTKMSKSKGNVIDPVDVIQGIKLNELKEKSQQMCRSGILSNEELQKALIYHKKHFAKTNGIPECGVDALRFTLLSQDVKSHYVSFDIAQCHANKLFCNKIWQSIVYTQMQFSKLKAFNEEISRNDLSLFDRWILSRLAYLVEVCNIAIHNCDFHIATKALKTFIHNEFCDVYVESTKPDFNSNSDKRACYAHAHTLSAALNTSLRCLAPFMIYLTDEVIPLIPSFQTNIIYNLQDDRKDYFEFPQIKDLEIWKNYEIERRAGKILECIDLVRELRGIYNMSNKLRPKLAVISKDHRFVHDFNTNINLVSNMARCEYIDSFSNDKKYITSVLDSSTQIYLEMLGDNIEQSIEIAKVAISKKAQKIQDSLAKMEAKMSNRNYADSVSEWNQVLDKEKLINKKKQLEQLQRLM